MSSLRSVPGLFQQDLPEGLEPIRIFQGPDGQPLLIARIPKGEESDVVVCGAGTSYVLLHGGRQFDSIEPIGWIDGRPVLFVRGKRTGTSWEEASARIDAIFVGERPAFTGGRCSRRS